MCAGRGYQCVQHRERPAGVVIGLLPVEGGRYKSFRAVRAVSGRYCYLAAQLPKLLFVKNLVGGVESEHYSHRFAGSPQLFGEQVEWGNAHASAN